MAQKYLVKEITCFVDPHGSPEDGGVNIYIDDDEDRELANIDEDLYYRGDYEKGYTEDELRGSEDGYHRTYERYEIRPITDEEAIIIQKIIDEYDNL